MRRGAIGIVDVVLGALGLGVFVYGDLVPNRTLRVVGFVLVTICIVAAAILATSHGDDT